MADDIGKQLRQHALMCNHGFPNGGGPMGPDPTECALCRRSKQAADEIERLRDALALACGLLSTYEDHSMFAPDQLMQQFLKEADRG